MGCLLKIHHAQKGQSKQRDSVAHPLHVRIKCSIWKVGYHILPFICVVYTPNTIIISIGSFDNILYFLHLAGWSTFRHLISYFSCNCKDNSLMDFLSCPSAGLPPFPFYYLCDSSYPPWSTSVSRTKAFDKISKQHTSGLEDLGKLLKFSYFLDLRCKPQALLCRAMR